MAVRRKTVVWSLVALAAAGLLALPKLMGGEEEGAAGAPGGGGGRGGAGGGPTSVTVTTVRQEALEDRVTTTGTLLPWESVELRSEVAGRVTRIGFEEGRGVGRGQTLVVLDTDVLEAELRAVRTRRDLASVQAGRQRQLFEIGGLSRQALDQAESESRVLDAGLAQINAEIARRRIVAPFAGEVGLRTISVGAYVSPGDAIATLRVTNPLKVEFTVPERYAARVRVGSAVDITVPGAEGLRTAVVYAIEPGVEAATRAVTVRARVANPGGALQPGAFAEVSLVLDRVEGALLVPTVALEAGADSASVFVLRGGTAERRPVRVGLRTADQVQVTGGLSAGDTVLTSGFDGLRPGAKVRVARAGFDPAATPAGTSAASGTSVGGATVAPARGVSQGGAGYRVAQ